LEKIQQVGDTGAHNTDRTMSELDIKDISLLLRNVCANLITLINDSHKVEKT
jgi:hypothetical protein